MKEVVMIVKCAGCGKKREIRQGEVDDDSFPMCDKCFMPMFPERVTTQKRRTP